MTDKLPVSGIYILVGDEDPPSLSLVLQTGTFEVSLPLSQPTDYRSPALLALSNKFSDVKQAFVVSHDAVNDWHTFWTDGELDHTRLYQAHREVLP